MKEEEFIEFETPMVSSTYFIKEQYCFMHCTIKKVSLLETIEKHTASVNEHIGDYFPVPTVIDINQLKTVSKEVRDYASKSPDFKRQIKCIALLTTSGLSKIIGNLFIRFNNPPYPTRLFTDKQKAIDWAKTFVNK